MCVVTMFMLCERGHVQELLRGDGEGVLTLVHSLK